MTEWQSLTILVIEDNPADFGVLERHLRHLPAQNVHTLHALSEEKALDLFQTASVDCVILDYLLGETTGLEVLKRLRASGNDVPVIMLTGEGNVSTAVEAMKQGAQDYLAKDTLTREDLIPAVRNAMQTVELQRQVRQQQHELEELTRQLKKANETLERLHRMDSLTDVANRRHFDEVFAYEWKRASRQGPLSLVMIDVDYFKQFNDTYGHLAGDDCLLKLATALRDCAQRSSDVVARYGGEEFALLLPGTDLEGALMIAEQARQAVEQLQIAHDASFVSDVVTISAGIASTERTMTAQERESLIQRADAALYKAKSNGRNRVATAPDLEARSTG